MNNLTSIDQLFGPPNPQTIKGKLINMKPVYYIIGGVLILVLIVRVYSKSRNIYKIKPTFKEPKKDTES
jgi:hypothetical protein